MTSGVTLREERLAAHVQQQELAAAMGVVHSAVAQLEKRARVRTETAERFRFALRICVRQRNHPVSEAIGRALLDAGLQLIAAGIET